MNFRKIHQLPGAAMILLLFALLAGHCEAKEKEFLTIPDLQKEFPEGAKGVFDELDSLYGGQEKFKIVGTAGAVILHEVDGLVELDLHGSSQVIGGFEKKESLVIKEESTLKVLRSVFRDPMQFSGYVMCIFTPDIAVEFADGKSSVSVLLDTKLAVAKVNGSESVGVSKELIHRILETRKAQLAAKSKGDASSKSKPPGPPSSNAPGSDEGSVLQTLEKVFAIREGMTRAQLYESLGCGAGIPDIKRPGHETFILWDLRINFHIDFTTKGLNSQQPDDVVAKVPSTVNLGVGEQTLAVRRYEADDKSEAQEVALKKLAKLVGKKKAGSYRLVSSVREDEFWRWSFLYHREPSRWPDDTASIIVYDHELGAK